MTTWQSPDWLVMLSHRVWEQTGWRFPPICFQLLGVVAFLSLLLVSRYAINLWLDGKL